MIYLDSMNHLFSDSSLYELYHFALKIGVKPEWNHYSRGFPHFDLMKSKIKLAKEEGATPISVRDPLWHEITKKMMSHYFNRQWHVLVVQTGWYESVGLVKQKILRLKMPEVADRDLPYQESRKNEQYSMLGNE